MREVGGRASPFSGVRWLVRVGQWGAWRGCSSLVHADLRFVLVGRGRLGQALGGILTGTGGRRPARRRDSVERLGEGRLRFVADLPGRAVPDRPAQARLTQAAAGSRT